MCQKVLGIARDYRHLFLVHGVSDIGVGVNVAAAAAAAAGSQRLIPYIYTAALQTYRTGVSLVHPVYFDYPLDENVYSENIASQFMFGDDVFVSPLLTPRNRTTNMTTHVMYLPGGRWVEMNSLRCLTGGRQVTSEYTMTEMGGAFVKEGRTVLDVSSPCIRAI